ncbi:MAG: NAD(P)-dependent alcohol dehydrogenase [Saprospiraceae bacterium]|nr:NAD(P)-dependent alcohol dehydrogenase [Saprospiraceae bacterium]
MKAILCLKYASAKALQVQEIPKPEPGAGSVLVKVRATAINDFDWSLIRGKPLLYRLLFGLRKPKTPIPGIEFSGTVEAIGTGVSSFSVGDAVYGDISGFGWGTFAEYCCVPEESILPMPDNMSFEEAAAIPHASMLALQGLLDVGGIKKGMKILINGAGGGVGAYGVQIAKIYEAEVTGVDAQSKLEGMRAIGYDQVLDYKKVDFTKNGQQYDLILDAKTNRAPKAYARALNPGGKYVTVGGSLSRLIQVVLANKLGRKEMYLLALKPNKGLEQISAWFAAGKIKPVIDGPYKLEEIPPMLQYFGEGKHQGKVIVSLPE